MKEKDKNQNLQMICNGSKSKANYKRVFLLILTKQMKF